MTGVKFCGIKREEDIEIINSLKPQYVGFVFWEKSKRNVTPEEACRLRQKLDRNIKTVGVFVDADRDFVTRLVTDGIIDLIQLHGNEDEEYIRKLREKTDASLIKAFEIKGEEDIDRVNNSSADMVLLDAGKGEGMSFSWSLTKRVNRPFFLAGGLSAENAAWAIAHVNPYALDVSSGIETDGVKNKEKMAAFIGAVRRADIDIISERLM